MKKCWWNKKETKVWCLLIVGIVLLIGVIIGSLPVEAAVGQATVWTLNSSNAKTGSLGSWSPGGGWEATSFLPLSDGTFRLLWTKDGQGVIWVLNNSGIKSGSMGTWSPGSTWRAMSLIRLTDGTFRMLWTRDGQATVWILNSSGVKSGSMATWSPGSTWRATGLEQLSDGTFRVLWTKDGAGTIWVLNSSGAKTGSAGAWSPGSTWQATSYFPSNSSSASGSGITSLNKIVSETLTVKKAGSGTGTITVGTQVCDAACTELVIPYIVGEQADVNVTPAAGSYFAGWETAGGVQIENIYYAEPGDTVFAIFELK